MGASDRSREGRKGDAAAQRVAVAFRPIRLLRHELSLFRDRRIVLLLS
jgi:hypothetical protein